MNVGGVVLWNTTRSNNTYFILYFYSYDICVIISLCLDRIVLSPRADYDFVNAVRMTQQRRCKP